MILHIGIRSILVVRQGYYSVFTWSVIVMNTIISINTVHALLACFVI